jgi:hypothetical protein
MHTRLTALIVVGAFFGVAGCAETTTIRTYPPGATVAVNGQPIGTGPIEFSVPRTQIPAGGVFHYQAERQGYRPAEGDFRTSPAKGRITGGIFTLGILFLFKNPTTLPEEIHVVLEPTNAPGTKAAADPAARLNRLEKLFEQGTITEEEYKRERYKVLHSL